MHDVLCVMALNVINEKIYAIMWFWFVMLFFVSLINLVWRMITILMHSRSPAFNRYILSKNIKGRLNTLAETTVTDNLAYKDWIFLRYLGKNVDGLLFKEIVNEVTDGIHKNISVKSPDELFKLRE
ncbi:hypothetical protein WA026_002750 [Henosepilachna vigintioctopunctata]|uniref:Innexin n=1 Tax=Henosepilachna vigintioctopunctata TaxID=420089 RepID=A0AAW1TVT8_9CUCU